MAVWRGGVKGYFHEKSLRKSVKSRQNSFFSLEKNEKFLLLGGAHPPNPPTRAGAAEQSLE